MLATKLTVLLLYRRIFMVRGYSIFDIMIRLSMVICCLYYITTTFVKTWECTPRASIWNDSIKGRCISIASLINIDGAFNTISDFFIWLLPIQPLRTLKMKKKDKLRVALAFTIGLLYVSHIMPSHIHCTAS